MVPYWISLLTMAGNANNEAERPLSSMMSVGDVSAITVPDDMFLSIQRATSASSKIYTAALHQIKEFFNLCQSCQTTMMLKN